MCIAFTCVLSVLCALSAGQRNFYSPPPVPQDVMVDVINSFGVELLKRHNEYNENNIALSPYGAVSVLVALSEGTQGPAHAEIQHALQLPYDISLVRIGLRDILRRLKSYFIPEEGFLAGLTFSSDNISLREEYRNLLTFYGYDVDSFNSPLHTTTATTRKSDTYSSVSTPEVTTFSEQAITNPPEVRIQVENETTTLVTVKKETTSPDVTTITTEIVTKTTTTTTTTATSEALTTLLTTSLQAISTAPPSTSAYITRETTSFPSTTETSKLETIQESTPINTSSDLPITEALSSNPTTEMSTEELITTSTPIPSSVPTTEGSSENNITPTTENTSAKEEESTNVPFESTTVSESVASVTISEGTSSTAATGEEITSLPLTIQEGGSTTAIVEETTSISTTVEEDAFTESEETNSILTTVEENASITATVEETTSDEENASMMTTAEEATSMSAMTTVEEASPVSLTIESPATEEPSSTSFSVEEIASTLSTTDETISNAEDATSKPADLEDTSSQGTVTKEPTTIDTSETASTTSSIEGEEAVVESSNENKKKRSPHHTYIPPGYYEYQHDSVQTGYEDDPNVLTFLVNGKTRKSNISFMTYKAVLPFCYIPSLKSVALSFPLDSTNYYLLLILPIDDCGADFVLERIGLDITLRQIVTTLGYTYVKATIPSFTLKGSIVLTPTLQKMGIRAVFEPRSADFSRMTNATDIYVTNIEQLITVTIRNYIDLNKLDNHGNHRRYGPVWFKADHPFLYFVMDSSLHVALMAGKVTNPLNSRIS